MHQEAKVEAGSGSTKIVEIKAGSRSTKIVEAEARVLFGSGCRKRKH